jgi:prolipoprotein diacylglyceryltransferase
VPNTFPVIFALGALISLFWLGALNPTLHEASKHPSRTIIATEYIDAGMVVLFAGLVGARAGFVFTHWGYYVNRPVEILWLWQGGLSWVSGVIGAILGLGLFAALKRASFWHLADALSLPVAVMSLACWTGCLFDGCAYGIRMDAGFLTPPTIDMFGGHLSRWPTQTVGVVYNLATLGVLYWLSDHQLIPGTLFCLSLSLISGGALALSFTRGDPVVTLFDLRIDTFGAASILLFSLSGLALRNIRGKSKPPPTKSIQPNEQAEL